MISRVPGTHDIIDLSLFNHIITQCAKHLQTYHFTEIATPIIEQKDLYRRLPRFTNDNLSKELLTITSKSKTEEAICLRPDAISSFVKAYIENGITQIPWKVYTSGPMFRNVRSERRRKGQFFEVGVGILGVSSISYDIELITMFDRFFSETLSLNGYALILNFLGCSADQREYIKMLKVFLSSDKAQGLCELCKSQTEKNSLRIFNCKNEGCQAISKDAPRIIDNLCTSCATEWIQVQDQLDLLSVTYVWNPFFVPELDHYNRTVFEFSSEQLGIQNRFCFGGRQDELIHELGGQEQSSISGTLDIDHLMVLLEPLKASLSLPQAPALYVVMPLGVEQQILALLVADSLRAQGLCIEVILEKDSLKSMMRKANKMGALYCLMIGPEEQQTHIVTIKNMITGVEDKVQQTDIYTYLTR